MAHPKKRTRRDQLQAALPTGEATELLAALDEAGGDVPRVPVQRVAACLIGSRDPETGDVDQERLQTALGALRRRVATHDDVVEHTKRSAVVAAVARDLHDRIRDAGPGRDTDYPSDALIREQLAAHPEAEGLDMGPLTREVRERLGALGRADEAIASGAAQVPPEAAPAESEAPEAAGPHPEGDSVIMEALREIARDVQAISEDVNRAGPLLEELRGRVNALENPPEER